MASESPVTAERSQPYRLALSVFVGVAILLSVTTEFIGASATMPVPFAPFSAAATAARGDGES